MSKLGIVTKGIIKENPVLVLMLGLCPTLATTTSAINGLGMGVSTMAVLICSNIVISILKNVIPAKVRIPCYIVVIAGFVTVVQLMLKAYLPALDAALGLFIPLIVVNCIILGRAEAYASQNGPVASIFDGIGMGLGFTMSITILAAFRELIGAGTVFGFQIMPSAYEPATIFILAPGAFFVLAFLAAVRAKIMEKKPKEEQKPVHCMEGGCASCSNEACSGKFYDNTVVKK